MAMPSSTIERNTVGRQTANGNSTDPEWVHNARMEEYRKVLYSGFDIPEAEKPADRKEEKKPVFAEVAPAANDAPVRASERLAAYHAYPAPATRRNLFEGIALKNGELVRETFSEPAQAPVAEVAPAAPAISVAAEEEDARPTPRTMAALNARVQTEASVQQGFFAGLSTRTKAILLTVAAAIVLVIALICINTAILNSLNAQIDDRQAIVDDLAAQAQSIQESISEITDPETIREWALENGLTHS